MTKAEATAPAKVPTKAEILEKLKQNDAKLPNTGQPIFELAQLDRSGVYWQFIGLCEQVEKLANADCSPDQKQAGIIELFKDFVSVEKQINEAKANAEQAKAERIRELQNELEHAKEVASHYYIDLDKCFINSLSDILNSPGLWTEAEITRAYCRDIESIRCHQWEAIGRKRAREYIKEHPEQFPDASSRNELMQMVTTMNDEMKNSFGAIQSAMQDHDARTADDHRKQDDKLKGVPQLVEESRNEDAKAIGNADAFFVSLKLSDTQKTILNMNRDGATQQRIADRLGISKRTVQRESNVINQRYLDAKRTAPIVWNNKKSRAEIASKADL